MNEVQRQCFVLMPFSDHYREIYDQIYKPVCDAKNLYCWRVDEIHRPGSITKDIVEGIFNADIIIADLTSRNPNVFYELGIAHASGNKTIMVAQKMEEVPFDVKSYRIIQYEQTIKGSAIFRDKLGLAIDELLQVLQMTNNPVQEVLGARSPIRPARTLLMKIVNYNKLPPVLRKYLDSKRIIYTDQLRTIDLDELANYPKLGRESLTQIACLLLRHDLYADQDKLHRFISENHIYTG